MFLKFEDGCNSMRAGQQIWAVHFSQKWMYDNDIGGIGVNVYCTLMVLKHELFKGN